MESMLNVSFAGLSPTELLEHLVKSTATGFFLLDAQNRITFMNPACEQITGYCSAEAVGKTIHALIHHSHKDGSSYPLDDCPINQTLQSHVPVKQVSSELFLRKDGTTFEGIYALAPILKDNQLIGTMAELWDITAEQNAKRASQESEEQFRLLASGITDYAIYQLDPQGYIISWNEGAERIYQYSRDEVTGQHFSLFFPPQSRQEDEPNKLLQSAKATRRLEMGASRMRKDGSMFLADIVITALHDPDGHLIGFSNISRDITSRKMVEARHSAILETALDALVTIESKNNTILEWNPAAERLFGYSRSAVIGKNMGELIIPERYREAHNRGIAHYMATGEGPVLNKLLELPALRADGSEFPAEIYITPMQVCETVLFTASLRDITERKQAEESLKHYAAKLEESNKELEQFATIASHDLQEPLRKIRVFSEMLSGSVNEAGDEYIKKISASVLRMQGLIDDLLALSRIHRQGGIFKKTDLNQVVGLALEELELMLAETRAQVLVEPLATIEIDQNQIKQVFQNLIGNALKYRQKDICPVIKIYGQQTGSLYQIFFEDNGIGFNEKYLDRIFRPFERLHSKNNYPGTGMGLTIVQKIVERHGGSVTATSQENQGSTFVVALPMTQA